ncbi:MAG: endonuclease III [Acidobacteria bacterium]|nr:endonuclease III [Acidobacteriota bacterium]
MTPTNIFDQLDIQHPNADTELHYRNAFELLAATILSAQCTDERVNQVTPALFATYPDPRALAAATPEALEPLVQSTGFYRVKARNLQSMAQQLVTRHGGQVPADMEALTALPGVGRKTANVVLGHALGIPGWPVDRHVLRVAERIGFIHTEDAVAAEHQLCALLPPARWTRASDTLILHGRRICKPKPLCDSCQIRTGCAYFKALGDKAASPRSKTRPAAKARTKK